MPPVVGLAIGLAASSAAVGGALQLGGSIFATLASAIDAGSIIGTIGASAIVGAGAGAATSAAAGGDPGQGALFGALTGGVGEGTTGELVASGVGQEAAQAIGGGVGTTAAQLAQGQPLGTALEKGLLGGAASYAASNIVDGINKLTEAPTGSAGQPLNVQAAGQQSSIPAPTPGVEQVIVSAPAPSPYVPSGGIYAPIETVVVRGDRAAGNVSTPIEIQPSAISLLQQQPETQQAEKSLISKALLDLFGPSGGVYTPSVTGAAPSAGGGAGTGGGVGAGGGGGAVAPLSPEAQAAILGASGQAGATSTYAPGGPIFGSGEGAKSKSPWNVESLRTALGT
jgi:hypothetical protein